MKKLINNKSVKLSSTKEGQRELLREHHNKINEIIEHVEALEKAQEELRDLFREHKENAYCHNPEPLHEDFCVCEEPMIATNTKTGKRNCLRCLKPPNSLQDTGVQEGIMKILVEYDKRYTVASLTILADKILALIKENHE
jgi:hypothetical protein